MINKRCFEADLGISRVVGHRRFEMRCTIAKYERIQCKRSDIRCHMLWGSPMIDWFDEWSYTKSSNSFFPYFKHTYTKVDLSHNSLDHCFIRFDGHIECEIIQLSIYYYLSRQSLRWSHIFPGTSQSACMIFFGVKIVNRIIFQPLDRRWKRRKI